MAYQLPLHCILLCLVLQGHAGLQERESIAALFDCWSSRRCHSEYCNSYG
jgi:hypothetical protein